MLAALHDKFADLITEPVADTADIAITAAREAAEAAAKKIEDLRTQLAAKRAETDAAREAAERQAAEATEAPQLAMATAAPLRVAVWLLSFAVSEDLALQTPQRNLSMQEEVIITLFSHCSYQSSLWWIIGVNSFVFFWPFGWGGQSFHERESWLAYAPHLPNVPYLPCLLVPECPVHF